MSYTRYNQVTFPPYKSGLLTVGYRLYNSDGSSNGGRVTSGISERGTGTAIYGSEITYPDGFIGELRWDTGDTSPLTASEPINPGTDERLDASVTSVSAENIDIESGINLAEAIQFIMAAVLGKLSGAKLGMQPQTLVFKNPAGDTVRITMVCDGVGNRTSVTLS